MNAPNRREFLLGTMACGACTLCSSPLRAFETRPVDVGAVSDYTRDGISDRWAKSHNLFVVRHKNRLYAVSATCTHRAFDLVATGKAIKCPKHGSFFSIQGKVQKGPATDALPRLGIHKSADGRLIVDPSQEFEEKSWDDAGCYVEIR